MSFVPQCCQVFPPANFRRYQLPRESQVETPDPHDTPLCPHEEHVNANNPRNPTIRLIRDSDNPDKTHHRTSN